ncbi:PIN-like domain-containing protein, partial [Burkholderia gladioli]|uniref:PIN-like domain-containing protein n=1 Tax=Burkholderia gladioli TaxID=28095 RepID=UPI001FC89008
NAAECVRRVLFVISSVPFQHYRWLRPRALHLADCPNSRSHLSALKKELGDAGAAVVQKIKSWEWNDPVNTAYSTVFSPTTIVSPGIDRPKILAELRRRQRMQIPPGYKDAAKDDLGIGDFLIWLTILEIGSRNKKPLIFVSGEEKSDWQHRSGGAGFLPRYELLDEYRRASGGQPFYMIPLSTLLELLNVKSESVDQIKHEEVRVQEASSIVVVCPACASDVPARLGEYIGATAHPRCSACSTQFHVHRTRNGVVIRGPGETKPRTEATQEEDVSCPNCGAEVATNLGVQRNATRWCRCGSCEAMFPIHRRADGGVMIGRVSRSPASDET